MAEPVNTEVKTPPHSLAAEQSILGGLLFDNRALESIVDVVRADDFYYPKNATVFRVIGDLIHNGQPADVLTVFEELKKRGKDIECEGLPYLNQLVDNTPSAANIRRYAQIVHEKSILRELMTIGDKMIHSAVNPAGREVDEILSDSERMVLAINERSGQGKKGFQNMGEIVDSLAGRLVELYQNNDGSEVTGVRTAFPNLDNVTAGFQRGDLIIVAGRPSMGKTTLAINIAENIAVGQELPVAIFSMEMGADQIGMRIISSIGNIDAQNLRKARLSDEDWRSFAKTVQRLESKPIYIDDTPGLRVTELASRARRLVNQTGPLSLIVVDYIQLMSGRGGSDNRSTELSEISRGLKGLAKELNCPVVVLSQLNRGVDARDNKRPRMSDLRESGAIEQDADVIMFIYRDYVYNKETEVKDMAEVIIAKQRNGPIGTVRMVFKGGNTKFLPWDGDTGYWEGAL